MKALAVVSIVLATAAILTACAGGPLASNDGPAQSELSSRDGQPLAASSGVVMQTNPYGEPDKVELNRASSQAVSVDSEPLDAELGCSAGGHLEYGLIPTRTAQ